MLYEVITDDGSAARRVFAVVTIADDGLPYDLAGGRVESEQMRFGRREIDLVAIDRAAAHRMEVQRSRHTSFPDESYNFV